MKPAPVLIVGAGPTGLVLALWLTRTGVPVRIVDRNSGPADYSRALGVQARTLEFYRQLGIARDAVDGGVVTQGVTLWVKGAKKAHIPFQNIGEGLTPYPFVLGYAQNVHERMLVAHLEAVGVQVERNTELVEFQQLSDTVSTTLRLPDGTQQSYEVQYVAGCDGAHSRVREVLGVGFHGGTYSELFYVADAIASGPAVDGNINIDLDTSDLLAVFAMKGAGHIRLVGTIRGEEAARNARELTFADVSQRVIEHLKLRVSTVNWFSTYRVHHRVADTFRSGRVFLAGDAAHVHSPVGAQGMNTGIGDAVNLAWKLAAVLGGAAADLLLDSYNTERIHFARRLVETTDRVFSVASSRGAVAAGIRTTVVPAAAPLLFRFAAMRRLLFRTVSQLSLEYRASPLSRGVAGSIHGGDRLPWIPQRNTAGHLTNGDNFEPLASLAWQLHVYGTPRNGVAQECAKLGIPLNVFPWSAEAQAAGVANGALYLIRPDGYVAVADPESDVGGLRMYAQTLRLAPPTRQPAESSA